MTSHERKADLIGAGLFLAAAVAIALLVPSPREASVWLIAGLTLAYVAAWQIRFEFAEAYNTPVQLVLVAMWVLLPLPLIPVLIAIAIPLAVLPEVRRGNWHQERWLTPTAEAWFCIPPVLTLSALAPEVASLGDAPIYALAFVSQVLGEMCAALLKDRWLLGLSAKEVLQTTLGTAQVDAVLAPISFVVAVAATDQPAYLLALAPLVWLLHFFSRDRTARYTASLELNRAYRGTVMLLADVVEFDDTYTGNHSRSVVDLVRAVAEEIGIDPSARQELEFAALLHDVGKIGIPKEILNKPAALTADEFEIMKTHTIEGQFMLDRVGGLLGRVGEIVRSCHERWDGNGYPDGLMGNEIPLAARIVFTCDAYSAMTTDRPYRDAMSRAEALAELRANAGSQFDPKVVAAFTRVVSDLQLGVPPATEIRALLNAANASSARVAS